VRPRRHRVRGVTLIDAVLVAALAGLVALAALPAVRVRHALKSEEAVMATVRELSSRIDAFRSAAKRDTDGDGRGEAPPLGDVLTPEDGFVPDPSGRAWQRGGYWYTVLVPGGDRTAAQPSDDPGLADGSETTYLVIAWPVVPGRTGMRAYLRTPGDGLLRHAIDGYPYRGPERPPAPRGLLVERHSGALQAVQLRSDDWVPPRETVGPRR